LPRGARRALAPPLRTGDTRRHHRRRGAVDRARPHRAFPPLRRPLPAGPRDPRSPAGSLSHLVRTSDRSGRALRLRARRRSGYRRRSSEHGASRRAELARPRARGAQGSVSMKVMVTGASTPLGRSLVRALADDPRVELVLAVASGPVPITRPKLTHVRADLRRSRELRRVLFGPARDLGIDAVAHVAIHPSARAQRVTIDATRDLLRLIERHPTIRRFVYRSFADIYRIRPAAGGIIGEAHPLDLSLPPGVRDRAEADLTVCTRMAMAPSLTIAVLRLAELFAPECGSQLYDYLPSRVCFRPIGFNPMMQLLSLEDGLRAIVLALF